MTLTPDRVIAGEPTGIVRDIKQLQRSFRVARRVGGFDPDERPAAPSNVTLTLTVREVKTRLEFRGKVSCDFLTADTCEADIKRYIFQIRRTDSLGAVLDGTNKRTLELTHKQAFDTDSELPHVIFNDIEKPKTQYVQARARILDKDERFSDWSTWTAAQLPVQVALPKPPTPTGVDLDFFSNVDKNSAARWRGRVRWNEVTNFDVPGGDHEEDVSRYGIQVQTSIDAVVGDDKIHSWTKEAKDDDADTVAHITFDVRHRKWWKRARVRCIDRWGRRGDWSAWTAWQRPGDEAPPNVTNVVIFDDSVDHVVLDFDIPADPVDPDIIHIDVAYTQAQIARNPSFSPLYRFDRKVLGSKKSFRIPKADIGDIFYGRVRSMNADDEKGVWIPGRILGNSSPSADPDGVKVGKSNRYTMAWTLNGNAVSKFYKQLHPVPVDSRFVKVIMRAGDHDPDTHPNDGCPTGSALEANLRVWDPDDETSVIVFDLDSRLKIPAGKHKDVVAYKSTDPGWNRQIVYERESIGIRIAHVGSGNPGSDVVIVAYLEPI